MDEHDYDHFNNATDLLEKSKKVDPQLAILAALQANTEALLAIHDQLERLATLIEEK